MSRLTVNALQVKLESTDTFNTTAQILKNCASHESVFSNVQLQRHPQVTGNDDAKMANKDSKETK